MEKNFLDVLNKRQTNNLFDFSQTKAPVLNLWKPVSWNNTTNIWQTNLQKSTVSFSPTLEKKLKPTKTLFINERQALEKMLNDWINEDLATQAIVEKRKEKWGTTKLTEQEAKALKQMANDDIDINLAIKAIKEKRTEDLTTWKRIWKWIFDFTTSMLSWWVGYVWWLTDAVTWWNSELAKWAMEARDFVRSQWDSIEKSAWELLWMWAIDYAWWKILWKI